jgi:hypoxanthine phosphoribosyltransferase
VTPDVLFTEAQIDARVNALANLIASDHDRPTLAAPILSGAFVFAADLLRALARKGLSLPVEFLWLRSYAHARAPSDQVSVLVAPGTAVRGSHVLLIDGVLDHGRTLETAKRLLVASEVRRITTAVAVDKRHDGALLQADHAAFTHVDRFIVGYGMDDAGMYRALPYIGTAD